MHFILLVLLIASTADAGPVSQPSQKKTSKVKKAKAQPRPKDACEWSMQCGPGEMCKIADRERMGVCVDDLDNSAQ